MVGMRKDGTRDVTGVVDGNVSMVAPIDFVAALKMLL